MFHQCCTWCVPDPEIQISIKEFQRGCLGWSTRVNCRIIKIYLDIEKIVFDSISPDNFIFCELFPLFFFNPFLILVLLYFVFLSLFYIFLFLFLPFTLHVFSFFFVHLLPHLTFHTHQWNECQRRKVKWILWTSNHCRGAKGLSLFYGRESKRHVLKENENEVYCLQR